MTTNFESLVATAPPSEDTWNPSVKYEKVGIPRAFEGSLTEWLSMWLEEVMDADVDFTLPENRTIVVVQTRELQVKLRECDIHPPKWVVAEITRRDVEIPVDARLDEVLDCGEVRVAIYRCGDARRR